MKLNYTLLILLLTITLGYSQQTVGVFVNDSTSFNGYTLIAPFNSNQTYLIDNCGFIVNEWNASSYWTGASVYLLEDGSLMRTCKVAGAFITGGSGGRLERYDWNDNLIWSYDVADSTQQQHHDIEVLSNGNILVLSFDFRTNAEALAAGRDPNLLNTELWSEKVVELRPIGADSAEIVWEWYLWDHLVQEFDMNANNFGVVEQSPELIHFNHPGIGGTSKDWIHANSIDYNPDLDQVMLSARNYNELWVIDHSTTTAEAASHTGGNSGKGGDILYRWGNPKAYNIVAQEQMFYGQHDAHWIPSGLKDAGKIMVYNNGLNYPNQVSRVQIIDPPVDQNGNYAYQANSFYLPDAPFWSYETPIYSDFISGAQRLENGNTLICDGAAGGIIEIDSLNKVTWRYMSPAGLNGNIASQGNNPSNNSVFRAYKYSPFYGAFTGRNLTPTVPIELNPLPSDCVVHFPTNTNESWQTLDIKVVQNPIQDVLKIENLTHQMIQIKVVDVLGRVVLEDNSNQSILEYNASNWAKGTYFMVAISENNKALYRQQIIKL